MVDVFVRRLDYNSSEDSSVRVKASEVRRRLAAYYTASSPDDVLRIELTLGSYVPHLVRIERHPADAPEPAAVLRRARSPCFQWETH